MKTVSKAEEIFKNTIWLQYLVAVVSVPLLVILVISFVDLDWKFHLLFDGGWGLVLRILCLVWAILILGHAIENDFESPFS